MPSPLTTYAGSQSRSGGSGRRRSKRLADGDLQIVIPPAGEAAQHARLLQDSDTADPVEMRLQFGVDAGSDARRASSAGVSRIILNSG